MHVGLLRRSETVLSLLECGNRMPERITARSCRHEIARKSGWGSQDHHSLVSNLALIQSSRFGVHSPASAR